MEVSNNYCGFFICECISLLHAEKLQLLVFFLPVMYDSMWYRGVEEQFHAFLT